MFCRTKMVGCDAINGHNIMCQPSHRSYGLPVYVEVSHPLFWNRKRQKWQEIIYVGKVNICYTINMTFYKKTNCFHETPSIQILDKLGEN